MIRSPVAPLIRAQRSRVVNVPSPLGGWNARDSLAAMQPTDAVILQNFFPTTSVVGLRQGSSTFATGLPGPVNTVMGYNPSSGVARLFAASVAGIYDVTGGGTVGAALVSGLASDKWQFVNFATPGMPYLAAVNGVDGYYVYGGSAWQQVTASSSPISITGVDPTTLSNITNFAQRLWFIQKNSLTAWYLPVDSLGGAAQQFPMNAIFRRGGSLVAMGVWTVDGGYGMQDYLAFVTTEGEIAIYGGTDPSQASTFSLVGVYQAGVPMGPRCFLKYGGDLLYIGKDGMIPLSKALASSRVNTSDTLTFKIQGAISAATGSYAANFGWQMMLHPLANLLLLNIPVGSGQQQQYVMNTITGAWCNFTGWAANCWERFQDVLYFGANGTVVKAWNGGYTDDGTQINAEGLQAFQYFGSPQLKQFTMARPVLQTAGAAGVVMGLNVDYDTTPPVGTPSFAASNSATWDVSTWDNAVWGQDTLIRKDWEFVSGVGYTAALHFKVGTNSQMAWVSTDYAMQDGGVL